MDYLDAILEGTGSGDAAWQRFYASLPPGPKAFVDDRALGRCMLKGRRGGGTVGLLAWLTQDIPPGQVAQYITVTHKLAYEVMWPIALKANTEYGLNLNLRKGALEIDTPSGGIVRLSGCQDIGEAEKFRGKANYRVAIDEVGSFHEEVIKYLVEDVLDPTLADLGGDMALCGTPGTQPMGYFYDRTDGDLQWPTYRFTCLENQHINGLAAIERAMKLHGYGPEHPTLLREWFGRWVRDIESIIYNYTPMRNGMFEPFEHGFTTIGCDVGYAPDQCGFTVIRSQPPHSNEIQILKSFRRGELQLPKIASILQQLMLDYGKSPDGSTSRCRIYIDTAGGSKVLAETLRGQYGLPCISAYKPDKKTRIESVRGGIQAGNVKLLASQCKDLLDEWSVLMWDEKRKDHSRRCVDDASDSCLYAFERHKHHYVSLLEEDKVGSPAWHAKQEAQDQREAEVEQAKERAAEFVR